MSNEKEKPNSKQVPLKTLVMQREDIHTIRLWFNCIEGVHPNYLEKRDYKLAKRIYEALNLPVRDAITERCV